MALYHLQTGQCPDLEECGVIDLSAIEHVILDEADQMIDLGFYPAIKRICARTPQPRQTIFFSATMPAEMKALSDEFLQDQVMFKCYICRLLILDIEIHCSL